MRFTKDKFGASCIMGMMLSSCIVASHAFVPSSTLQQQQHGMVVGTSSSPVRLGMAGFGGGGASASKSNKKGGKKAPVVTAGYKPKQQWDRYQTFKKETKIPVAVRIVSDGEDDGGEWLEVGRIKTKENSYTAMAVALQRALIADHAKRLYPLQVSNKVTLQWAYAEGGDEDNKTWTTVDKSIVDGESLPEGIEKMIGFEGTPDPASGFYCIYDGGQIKK